MMENIKADVKLIAGCGLYCGACRKYVNGKCPGCEKNEKASWCAIRTCCMENKYMSCADCNSFADVKLCRKYNNPVSRIIGFIFQTDRHKCIEMIREKSPDFFAAYMAENKIMSIKRR